MKYSNTIEYNISTKLDASGLTKLQAELQKIELSLQRNANRELLPPGEVEKAREQLSGLSKALTDAFNPSLGIIDLSKLQSSLNGSKVNAESLSRAFKLAGSDGEIAFNNLINQLGRFDSGIAKTNSSLDKLYTTMSNTFRWGLVSSFFSQFMNGIHSSIDYVKELDESLTQIMLVTDYNRDSMNEYAKSANEAAKALSMSTVGMTNASLIFAQQGFGLGQSQELAELSAKLANASQQDTAATSDQITAYMNAYGLQNDMAALKQAMDNWALIANVSAADVDEIAEAAQRSASMANAVGVSGEALAAQIATIESVTREAPEQIGNGLKTLYARFSDLSLGKTDEEGVGLGKVTSTLQNIGVQILDQFGQVRDMDSIIEDLMDIWQDLDDTAKLAAAQALAGKYQVNRFFALMDNRDMYEDYVTSTGSVATGTLEQMNEEYAQSLAGRMQKLQTTLEGIFNNLFETDDFYKFIDVAQTALDLIDNLTEAMGGGIPVLTALAGLMAQVFSKNWAQEITRNTQNRELDKIRVQNAENVGGVISTLGLENAPSEASKSIVDFVQQGAKRYDLMSTEQVKQYNQILDDQVAAANRAATANKNLADTIAKVGAAAGIGLNEPDAIFTGDTGEINTSNLIDAIANTGKSDFSQIEPEDFANAAKEASDFAKVLVDVENIFEEFKNGNGEGSIDGLATSLDYAQDKLITLYESGAISNETFERMTNTLIKAASHMENWDEEAEKAIDDIYKLSLEAIDLESILKGLASGDIKWENLDESVQKAVLEVQNAKTALEGIGNLGEAFLKGLDTQGLTKNLVELVGAVTSLTSAYMSFINLGSIWQNEDLSKGEKFLQTLMTLGVVIPQVSRAIKVLTEASESFSKLQTILNGIIAMTATSETSAGLAAIFMGTAMKSAAGIAGFLSKALTVLTGPWGIVIAALGALAGIAWNTIRENIKKAKEDAIEALDEAKSKLEEVEKLQEQAKSFNEKYEIFKENGENGNQLIEDAENLARSLKEAGLEITANEIHLAAVKAQADKSTDSYEKLADAIKQSEKAMSDEANTDVIKASAEVLKTQNKDLTELIIKEQELKKAREDLNNLDPFDPNYESQREELEKNIEKLKEFIQANQEAYDAAHSLMDASGNLLGNNLALTTGHEMRALGTRSNENVRAASMDYYSLQEEFSKSVAGFDQLDKIEQMDFMLQHVQDDAQKAAIQVEQLMYANENLSSNDQKYLTSRFEQAGFSAEQSLKLVATLDENASVQEITNKINEITQSNEPFEVALKATLDPEQVRDMVKSQLAEYQPTDEDVKAEDFQTMTNMFMSNEENMGKEGTPFEDYSSELLDNAEGLEQVIESILRYDDAVSSLDKNLDDWQNALKDTNKFSTEHIHAVQELQETYSDFLDLSEDFDVSEDFAANADNLELMEKAANGVEGAYEDLAQAAAQDILIHADISDIDGAKEALSGLFDYLNDDAFANLNVGDALDLSSIEDQINALADATGWTADQMSAYLAGIGMNIPPDMFEPIEESANSMANHVEGVVEGVSDTILDNMDYSVDTEVESKTDTQPDEIVYTNLIPHAGRTATIASTFPVGSANPTAAGTGKIETQTALAHVTGVEYTAESVTAKDIKEMTGYGVTSKPKKGGKGGVRLKDGASGTKGSTGATKHSGGSRPAGGGGKGGGGGGGGGGSGKTIQPKEKKTHQKDYYEEVDSQLKKLDKTLSKVEAENDRLTGDKARANYDKQIKLLQKEIKLQQQKLKIMEEQELKDVDENLIKSAEDAAKALKEAGVSFEIPAFEYDEDGVISNYEEVSKAIDDAHNKLIDAYNEAAAAGDEETTKAIEEQIKHFDEYGAKLLEDARRHDELQAEIEDTKKTLEDLEDAIEDIAIAVYQASQEAIDNLKELREGWAEMEGFFSGLEIDSPFRALIEDGYKLDEIYTADKDAMEDYYNTLIAKEQEVIANSTDEDEIAAAQRNIAFYQGQKDSLAESGDLDNGLLGLAQQDLARLTQWMNNPEDPSNPFGKDTKALEEAHKAAYDRVREMTLEYEKWVADYRDNLIDAYDDIYDRQKEVADKFDNITDDLERTAKAYKLYYGNDSYDAVVAIEGQKYDTLMAKGDVLRQREARWHEEMLKYYDEEGNLREGVDEKVAKEVRANWEETIEKIKDNDIEAAEAARAAYEANIDAAAQHAKDAFAANIDVGFGSGMAWDDLKRTWEEQKDYSSRYKDDIERSYEVDKLRSKYLDLLDNSQNASLGTQRKIRQQMEEQLDLLENQTTMSQYDVDLANAKYNILQKQIALEEAQQNKNQMKLKRDAQGNYSYVYTANEGDVRAAENDLLDTEYDAYEMTKEATINNTDLLLSKFENYLAQRAEIEKKYSAKDEETQAKKQAALEALEQQWAATREALMEDFSDTNAGMRDILMYMMESSVDGAKDMLQALEDGNNETLNNMGAQWMVWGTQIDEVLNDDENGIVPIVNEATSDMEDAWDIYRQRMDDSIGYITDSLDSYEDAIGDAQDAVSNLTDEQERLNEALAEDWQAVDDAAKKLADYEAQLKSAKDSMSNLRQELQAAYAARDQAEAEKLNYKTILDDIREGKRDKEGNVINDEDNPDGSNPKGGSKDKLDTKKIKTVFDLINNGTVGNEPYRTPALRGMGYSDRYINAGQYVIDHVYTPEYNGYGDMALEKALQAAAARFDTGGYTGKWSNINNYRLDNGKLAVLHEKELVLNQTDTENILEAVKYMREFASSQLSASSITADLIKGISQFIQGDTIEQRVEIKATFPNVNTTKEIEDALIGLADKAYQYAHRNTFKDMKINY